MMRCRFPETLSPAYGRDYTSKAKLAADWNAGKDFLMHPSGRYVNAPQLAEYDSVTVRYGAMRKVAVLKRTGEGAWK